jgi:hypothetical protein
MREWMMDLSVYAWGMDHSRKYKLAIDLKLIDWCDTTKMR